MTLKEAVAKFEAGRVMDDIEYRVGLLELRHGDILVFKPGRALSREEFANASKVLQAIAPKVRSVILEPGMDFDVIRQHDDKAAA